MPFRIRPVPGEPGTTADERIIPDLEWIRRNFRVDIRDAYAATGHAAGGEHPLGLGADIVPGPRGSWDDVDRLAAFAARHPGVFRFVGYDGRFGTTKWPDHGRGNHLHLSWRHTSKMLGRGRVRTLTGSGTASTPRQTGPADWLREGGWTGRYARYVPIMVAIGGAESHWQVDATNTNTDGSTDDGWLQINSVHGFNRQRLREDPVYAARAGLQVFKRQGLDAWVTYQTGAWRKFRGQTPTGTWSRTRPGGEAPGEGGNPETVLASWFGGPNIITPDMIPGASAAGNAAKDAAGAVGSVVDFLKWISWIFHPRNILRIVEFQVGFALLSWGLVTMFLVWRGSDSQAPMRMLGDAVSFTPPGRALRVARGKRSGRKYARSEQRRREFAKASKQGRAQETQKQGARQLRREARKDKDDIPF